MYKRDEFEARIIAIGVGGALLLVMGPLLAITSRNEWLACGLLVLCYTALSAISAFVWPQLSWRTGLWFFVFLPPALLASFLLSLDVPIDWHAELKSLSEYALAFASACFGGWLGAMISKSRAKKPSTTSFSGV